MVGDLIVYILKKKIKKRKELPYYYGVKVLTVVAP